MREQDPFFPSKPKHVVGLRPKPRRGNRGRIEIIGDILAVCQEALARRTHVMYKGNLSYVMLREYMEELVRKGLIEERNRGSYLTTEKGRAFLKYYEVIRKMLAEDESNLCQVAEVITSGSKLLSLGVSSKFLQRTRMSGEQERDLVKGILYLRERARDLYDGN
jgi:predicted transcriptional regulator